MNVQFQQLKFNVLYAERTVLTSEWRTENFKKVALILPYSRIYLPIAGEASYDFFGQHYELRPGMMLFIPPFARTFAKCESHCEMYWSNFNCYFGDSNVDVFSIMQPKFSIPVKDIDYQIKLFETLNKLFVNNIQQNSQLSDRDSFEANAALGLLMLPFLDTISDNEPLHGELELFLPLLKYIKSHPEENYSLTSLAKRFHCHKTYLTNLFKKTYGVPLMQYINRQKLNYSLRLLKTTNLPISAIASKVGMICLANFSRIFQKHFGLSPSNFRKTSQNDNF
ncbi:MAG: helix-turn-helix transcriptional regulator [Victivallales bacterium]|nr:helix-turn-helix transcriptional regulator [Victivallales bacterium]